MNCESTVKISLELLEGESAVVRTETDGDGVPFECVNQSFCKNLFKSSSKLDYFLIDSIMKEKGEIRPLQLPPAHSPVRFLFAFVSILKVAGRFSSPNCTFNPFAIRIRIKRQF